MTNKIFDKIATPRLIIRPINLKDAEPYFLSEQTSYNDLLPHWSWVKTDKTVKDIEEFIDYAVKCNHQENPIEMYFSIYSLDNTFLGCIWFFEINWYVPHFEIAYWLDTRKSGNGYMSEAVNALTRTCFTLYKANRVQIKISSENRKSQALAERLNFNLEANMENYFYNFATNKINNGLLYACCNLDLLPTLNVTVNSS